MANPHKYINLTVCMERFRTLYFPFIFLFFCEHFILLAGVVVCPPLLWSATVRIQVPPHTTTPAQLSGIVCFPLPPHVIAQRCQK